MDLSEIFSLLICQFRPRLDWRETRSSDPRGSRKVGQPGLNSELTVNVPGYG